MTSFITLFEREIKRFLKVVVQTIVTPMVSASLYLLVFGITLGAQVKMGETPYLLFLLPGLMMMGLMNNAFQNSSSSIVNLKFTGELEDLKIVPLSHSDIIWAMSLSSVIRGAVVCLMTYLVGLVLWFIKSGEFLPILHPIWFLVFVVLGGLVFGHIGLMAAMAAKNFEQLSMFNAFLLLPLTYLGGVFLPIDAFGSFWGQVIHANPLLYFINGLRYSVLGAADFSPWTCFWVGLVSLLVFHFWVRVSFVKGSFSRW